MKSWPPYRRRRGTPASPRLPAAGRAALAVLCLTLPAAAQTEGELPATAEAIHARVLAIDTHVDIPPDFGTEAYDPLGARPPRQKVDLTAHPRPSWRKDGSLRMRHGHSNSAALANSHQTCRWRPTKCFDVDSCRGPARPS